MEKLHIHSTKTTPEIILSPEENIFVIRGTSTPEDVREMYYPVIEWIKKFLDDILDGKNDSYSSENPLEFQIDLAYFNSSSAKFLFDIFSELKRLTPAGIPFAVEWFYDEDDLDMKEAGQNFSSLVETEFVYIPKKNK